MIGGALGCTVVYEFLPRNRFVADISGRIVICVGSGYRFRCRIVGSVCVLPVVRGRMVVVLGRRFLLGCPPFRAGTVLGTRFLVLLIVAILSFAVLVVKRQRGVTFVRQLLRLRRTATRNVTLAVCVYAAVSGLSRLRERIRMLHFGLFV